MRIIKETSVKKAGKRYPKAAPSLKNWIKVVRAAKWRTLLDMRETFNSVDPATVKSGRTVYVFNICGNEFRLIAAVHFNRAIVYFLKFLTHAEYSKNTWKDDL